MDHLKTLSVTLDYLSGHKWWYSFCLVFLIIIAYTGSKKFRYLQN